MADISQYLKKAREMDEKKNTIQTTTETFSQNATPATSAPAYTQSSSPVYQYLNKAREMDNAKKTVTTPVVEQATGVATPTISISQLEDEIKKAKSAILYTPQMQGIADNRSWEEIYADNEAKNARLRELESQLKAAKAEEERKKAEAYDAAGAEMLSALTTQQLSIVDSLIPSNKPMYEAEMMQGVSDNRSWEERYAEETAKENASRNALRELGYTDDQITELIRHRSRQLNRENYEAEVAKSIDEAKDNGFVASLKSVPQNLTGGLGALSLAVQNVNKKLTKDDTPVDYYTKEMVGQAKAQAARQTVTERLEENDRNIAAFLYNTGMSMADSAAIAGLTAIGIPTSVGSVVLGGSAATSAAVDAKNRGATDSDALLTGLVAGAAEAFFEKYSLESVLKTKPVIGTTKQKVLGVLKNIGKQSLVEGSEEAFTTIANTLADAIINADRSAYQQSVQEYILAGKSAEEAKRLAQQDWIRGLATDFLGGAISGGVMGGGATALRSLLLNASMRETANETTAPTEPVTGESATEAIVEPTVVQPKDALESVLLDSVSPTARQINEIAKDPAQLERLGIDSNGKTASQLRAEVREALAPKTTAPVAEAQVEQTQQMPVQNAAEPQGITPADVNVVDDAGNTVGAAQQGFDPFTASQNQYGTLPGGENPVRSDDVPVSVDGVKKVSQNVVTMKGAAPTTNARVKQLERAVLNGDLSYIPGTNKAQIRAAMDTIKYKGWHQALADWTAAVNRGQVSANLVAEGALLYNAASNSYADETEFLEIARTYTELLHNAGQATQAARILKTLTPSGRLYLIESAVKKMNDERDVAWIWMERVGEMLADKLKGAVGAEQKSQVATVTETILDDLYYFAINETKLGEELREKRKATRRVKRTDLERFSDLFKNPDKYHAAWDTARNTIIEKFGKDKDVMKALDSWINTFLDESGAESALSKELFGKNAPITIPDELVGKYLKAETDAERDDVVTQIASYVAEKLPVPDAQKFDAWRHIMMLGNFKTIERNAIGNTGMMGVRAAHNAVAATVERVFGTDRTRSATVSKEWMDAAREYYEQKEVKADAMGDNKYSLKSEKDEFMRLVKEKQKPFGYENGKPVHDAAVKFANKANEIVSWAMNNKYFGDEAFNRHAFARMFAGYLKANGVTVEQFNDHEWRDRNWLLVEKAKTFAAKEAKEATFRDDSTLSKILTNLRYTGEQKPLGDAYNIMLRGLQPYINTPANITMRAIEYSPVGLFTSAASTAQRALSKTDMVWNGGALGNFAKKGMEISGSQLANEWAKSLTGSAIFVLGMIFRNKGWLRGSSDDDEKQAAFDDLTGVQEYSIEFGDGTSVTFDWFTPTAVPLFAGAEFADAVNEYGVSAKALGQALSSGAEVLLNASVLQGIEDALQQVRYSDDNASLPKIAANAALNYFLQGIGSQLVGQISRAADGVDTMTYVDRDSSIPDVLQKTIGSFARKTPFMDTYQVPYIDAWGRTEEGDFMTRLVNNMFNPAFTSKIEVSKVESELQRLYDSVGGDGDQIFPTRADKSFTVDEKTYHLSAEEYVKYATAKGEYSLEYVTEAVNSWMYKNMSDADKAKLLDNLYKYANYKAKREAVPAYDSKTFKNVAAADKAGTSPVLYYAKK